MRIGLIGCVKQKVTGPPVPARDLYISPLFRGRVRFAERTCDRWFVLSAKHGLLAPEQILEPYDVAMMNLSAEARRAWSGQVIADLWRVGGLVDMTTGLGCHTFEVHAGAVYRDFGLVEGLRAVGAEVSVPAAGLTQGRQLAFYRVDGQADR